MRFAFTTSVWSQSTVQVHVRGNDLFGYDITPDGIKVNEEAQFEQLRTTKAAQEAFGAFMFEVQELDTITEFDEKLWLTIIDTVTVHADGRMIFKFQGGTEIDV